MEARTLGIGAAAAVLGTFASIVMFSLERDHRESARVKARERLKELETELQAAEQRRDTARSRLDALKAEEAASQDSATGLETRITAARTELASVNQALAAATAKAEEMSKQKRDALERNRAAAVGTTYPQLTLTNGKVLLGAKLTKLTPQELSFSHSLGRTSVRWSQLPAEIIERFELGGEASGEVIEEPVVEAPDTPNPQPDDPQITGLTDRQRQAAARVRSLHLQIARLDNSIAALMAKAAPNQLEVRKLRDRRAVLQVQLLEAQQASFVP